MDNAPNKAVSTLTKILAIVVAVLLIIIVIAGIIFFTRSSTQRTLKDIESEYTGGLDRHINVYSYDGDKLAEYDGRIDIAERNDGVVKFQLKGKRYIYYNATVEVIEK